MPVYSPPAARTSTRARIASVGVRSPTRYGTRELDLAAFLLDGRLKPEVTVTRRTADVFWGVLEVQDVEVVLRNPDGELLAAALADPRGRRMVLRRLVTTTGEPITEWVGVITQVLIGADPAVITIRGSDLDPAIFTRDIPGGLATVDTGRFPNAVDVGALIPLVNGIVEHLPIPYVNQDYVAEHFDYLLGWDALSADQLFWDRGNVQVQVGTRLTVQHQLLPIPPKKIVLVDAVTDVAYAGSSRSWTHVVNGTDRCLIVGVTLLSSHAVSGITMSGHALTRIGAVVQGGARAEFWVLMNPARGSHSIALTATGSVRTVAASVSLTGVDQTLLPASYGFTSSGGRTDVERVTVASRSGALVLAVLARRWPNRPTPQAPATELWSDTPVSGSLALTPRGAGLQLPGAPSVTPTWTTPASLGLIDWCVAAISVSPAPTYQVSPTLYPGLTAVRFNQPQLDFSDQPVKLYATIRSDASYRNPATGIRRILTGAHWGLQQDQLDDASFSAMADALEPLGFACDWAIYDSPVRAQDLLAELMLPRSLRLGRSELGWSLAGDVMPQVIALDIQAGPEDGNQIVVSRGPRARTALADMVGSVVLKYRFDSLRNDFLFTISRVVFGVPPGQPKVYELRTVRDHLAADLLLSYLSKLFFHADDGLPVTLTLAARALSEGDVVRYSDSLLGYDRALLRVQSLTKAIDQVRDGQLVGWDPAILEYTQSVPFPPADPALGSMTDFTLIAPDPAENLQLIASGTSIASDGTVWAWVRLQFDTPTVNYSQAIVRWRETDTTDWSAGVVTKDAGTGVRVTIPGLLPGTAYDFRVTTVNQPGNLTADAQYLADQTTPTDPRQPPAPTALAADTVSTLVILTVTLDLSNPAWLLTWADTLLLRATVNDPTAATEISRVGRSVLLFDKPGTGTWYYWAKVRSRSGVDSNVSPGASVTL